MAINPNALFGFQNLSDPNPGFWMPTFFNTVGNWQPSAPLTNLQQRFFAYKTRSVNCDPSNTQFVMNLGVQQAVLAVVIPRHNMSINATMTVSLYTDAALTQLVATSTVNVSTQFAWGTFPFAHSSWFTGKIDAETARLFPQPAMVLFPTAQIGQYVKVQLNDPGNANPYIELQRLFVTPGYQPSVNIVYGAQNSVNDPTIVTRSLGGADFYDQRAKHRTIICSIDYLGTDEAMFMVLLNQQLRLGLSGQFFFSMYPADPSLFGLTSFVATMSKLDPVTAAVYGRSGVAFAIEEVVA